MLHEYTGMSENNASILFFLTQHYTFEDNNYLIPFLNQTLDFISIKEKTYYHTIPKSLFLNILF